MKKQFLFLALLISAFTFSQNPTPVRTGLVFPNATEDNSTTRVPIFDANNILRSYISPLNLVGSAGFVPFAEYTTAQRDAIVITADTHPIIYNVTTGQYEGYNGSTWEAIGSGGGDLSDYVTLTGNEIITGAKEYNISGPKIAIRTTTTNNFGANTFTYQGSDSASIIRLLTLYRRTTQTTSQNGMGGSLSFYLDGNDGFGSSNIFEAGQLIFGAEDVTFGSLEAFFRLRMLVSGTYQNPFGINGQGQVSFLNYNFPILDGTAGQVLQTDGSGNLSFGSVNNTLTIQNEDPDNTEIDNYTWESINGNAIFKGNGGTNGSTTPAIAVSDTDLSVSFENQSIAEVYSNGKKAVTYEALQDYVANNVGGGTALTTTYDNSDSGLSAVNVKAALDEITANLTSNLIIPVVVTDSTYTFLEADLLASKVHIFNVVADTIVATIPPITLPSGELIVNTIKTINNNNVKIVPSETLNQIEFSPRVKDEAFSIASVSDDVWIKWDNVNTTTYTPPYSVELLDVSLMTPNSATITFSGGTWNFNATPRYSTLTLTGLLTVGKTYKVELTVENYVSGNIRFTNPATSSNMTGNGTYVFELVATSTNVQVSSNLDGANSFDVTSISVKEKL